MHEHPIGQHHHGRLHTRLLTVFLVATALLVSPWAARVVHAADPASGTVTVVKLNVRSQPSITSSVLGSPRTKNATVDIVDTSEDGDWYQIKRAHSKAGCSPIMYQPVWTRPTPR
ncbi:MAG: SH3 domain-containing protein [Anaerolineales bacterium]|nr:SH3 domain-containing protein [Anaerolineales bacterium]